MRYVFLLASLFLFGSAWAQCPHDPRLTGDTILCPNETGTLEVQTAEGYQWYQRQWGATTAQPLPGDTNKTLQINSVDDVLTYISVETEVNGCWERSPEVLIDGYAFIPPVVQSTGSFRVGQNGETLLCTGDTVFFELMLPYTENIQWYDGGNPITGQVDPTLVVTQSGFYTVEGAPAVCPNFVQQLGVTLVVIKYQTQVPVLQLNGNMLEVTNPGGMQSFEWYLNDTLLLTPFGPTYMPTQAGLYHVVTVDQNGCEGESNQINFDPSVGIAPDPTFAVRIYPTLVQNNFHVAQTQPSPFKLRVVNVMGQVVFQNEFTTSTHTISTQSWPAGMYWVQWQRNNSNWETRPISVVR